MEMQFEKILFEVKDQVAYITLHDPANMNPVTAAMMADLVQCLNRCEQSEDIRCVVFRGAGGNFSAGGNVKVMKERLDKGINAARMGIRAGGEFIMRLKTLTKPTIAWIEGAVAGVGISIAMACDFSIASEEAKMVFAFINIGYVPDGGIIYMLNKAVGSVKTTELLMSGRRFSGADARDWGIITDAVPAASLEETVERYVRKYKNGPTVAYGQIKKLINRSCYTELNACMQDEVDAQYICSRSQDHKAAVDAFVKKQKPVFTGK